MKVLIEDGKILNIYSDNYVAGNPVYDNSFIQITSYASDIDMKDVETNQAWKFKIVNGELQYDQDKIKTKLNNDIIAKRRARYMAEVDPLTLEGLLDNDADLIKLAKEIKAKIKLELPKQ